MIALVLLGVLFYILLSDRNNNLSDKIINYIDYNADESNICTLDMNEITDFKWDKMLFFGVGSNNTEISNALGVEYKDSTDLVSGIVFVYNNKIVYKESIPYNPDHPSKLLLYVGNMFGEPSYRVFTPNDAIFKGSRREKKGEFYYKIEPHKTN